MFIFLTLYYILIPCFLKWLILAAYRRFCFASFLCFYLCSFLFLSHILYNTVPLLQMLTTSTLQRFLFPLFFCFYICVFSYSYFIYYILLYCFSKPILLADYRDFCFFSFSVFICFLIKTP